VGGVLRRVLEGLHDDLLDVVVGDRAGCTWAGLVVQRFEAALQEPVAPLANRVGMHPEA
jgi:hypothetical protein